MDATSGFQATSRSVCHNLTKSSVSQQNTPSHWSDIPGALQPGCNYFHKIKPNFSSPQTISRGPQRQIPNSSAFHTPSACIRSPEENLESRGDRFLDQCHRFGSPESGMQCTRQGFLPRLALLGPTRQKRGRSPAGVFGQTIATSRPRLPRVRERFRSNANFSPGCCVRCSASPVIYGER